MTAYPFRYPGDLAELCREQAPRVQTLLETLDLTRPGLAEVARAQRAGDLAAACEALLAYYRRPEVRERIRLGLLVLEQRKLFGSSEGEELPVPRRDECRAPERRSGESWPLAAPYLDGQFAMGEVRGKLRHRPDGHIDWADYGPVGDIEWAFGANRHACFNVLFVGWLRTGNPAHARAVDLHLADWLTANLTPRQYVHDPVWRELEVGLRLGGPWVTAFYGFQEAAEFSPVTRILMLASVAEQGAYLRQYHKTHPNHLLMEMNGLAMAAVAWPEIRESGAWLQYAAAQLRAQPRAQVYPDGAQNELTSGYHLVSLVHLDLFARIAGAQAPVDREFSACLERMWSYLAYTLRPDGRNPLNNDTDLLDLAPVLRDRAELFHRPDWTYIATQGREGTPPQGLPSVFFPWAGQLLTRSGWDADAHWGFFDAGPLGVSGHQHRDKLHVSIQAGGRDLLVDSGRYWYKWDVYRQYFLGTHGHNAVLVNGCGQADDVETVSEPFAGPAYVTPLYDYACASFTAGFLGQEGELVHTRALLYLRGHAWLVVDRIRTGRPRTLQPLWHFHPECTVERQGQDVLSVDPGLGNLRITPLARWDWRVDLVKGATDPDTGRYRMWKVDLLRGPDDPTVQGWYSPHYNTKHPCWTAVYRTTIPESATFAWVLTPARGAVPPVRGEVGELGARHVRLTLHLPGAAFAVGLDLDSAAQPKVERV